MGGLPYAPAVELVDAVLARRMVRDFDGGPVDPALVDRLLDLARRAPSAGNSQGTEFLVLEGAYVARYGEPDKAASGLGRGADAWPVPFWLVDTAFATMTLLLAATDAGLGALFYLSLIHI